MRLSHMRSHAERLANHPDPPPHPLTRGFRCAELVQGEDNHLERPDEELAGQLDICGARTMAHRVRSAATRLAVAGPRGRGGCGEIGAHLWPATAQRAVITLWWPDRDVERGE